MFGKGISKEGDVLDLAVNLNIIVKAGAWFSYNDAKIGQGRENAKIYLSQHPDIMAEVENKVRAHYNLPLKDAEPTALAESGMMQSEAVGDKRAVSRGKEPSV